MNAIPSVVSAAPHASHSDRISSAIPSILCRKPSSRLDRIVGPFRDTRAPQRDVGDRIPRVVNPDEQHQYRAAPDGEQGLSRMSGKEDPSYENRRIRKERKSTVKKPVL